MSKKIVAILTILIMLTVFFIPTVYGIEDEITSDAGLGNLVEDDAGGDNLNEILNEGTATVTTSDGDTTTSSFDPSTNTNNTVLASLAKLLSLFPKAINKVLSVIAIENEDIDDEDDTATYFTIESLLTNEYPLFNIDMFSETEGTGDNATFSNQLKTSTATWYLSIRNLAIIGCAIIVIYVGIRMAISTVAEDKAKYKRMLMSWAIGLILIFFMHYIILILIKLSNAFVELVKSGIEDDTDTVGMEVTVLGSLWKTMNQTNTWGKYFYLAMYCVLTYYELKFFIRYIFRVLKVFILTIISPLICMLYPIDAVGDGRSQSFNAWLRRIMMEIFIQPIHLIIYVVFIYSAGAIAEAAPLICILFFVGLDKAEGIIMSALKLNGEGIRGIQLNFMGKKGK